MEGGSHEDAAHDIELRKAQHHAHAGSPAADAGGGDADAGSRPARRLEDTRTMSMTSAVSKQSQNSTNMSQNEGESGAGEGPQGAGDEDFIPTTSGVVCALFRGPSSAAMAAHLKTIRTERHCSLISSTGTFRSGWDIASLFAVLFCTFSVPYDMCFDPPKSLPASAVDMAVEAFFLIEICMNFFTTYLDADDGEEITHPLFIAVNYAKAWLPIDAVSSIPSEMVERIFKATSGGTQSNDNLAVLSQLRIIRILRLTKLLRLLRIRQLMEDIELRVPSMRTVFGLFRLLFMMMILAHVQACVFFAVAKQNIGNSWVSKYHSGCCETNLNFVTGAQQAAMEAAGDIEECFSAADMPSLEVLYTNAIYWSFTTLTSVGYGEITPCNEFEMVYCTVGMLLGSGMFAYIVGNISEVITAVAGQKIELKNRMRELQEYIVTRKLPKEISVQLRQQCLHRWRKIVFSEEEVLEEFTPQIRREVVRHVNEEALKKISFLNQLLSSEDQDFKQIAEEFAVFLATKLIPLVVSKGDDVISYNDEGGDMFIIMLGRVDVQSTTGRNLATFDTGCVNELGLLSEMLKGPSLSEEEQAFLEDNMPAAFADIPLSDFLPLPQTKSYHAVNEVETLRLQSADFREAIDRTNNKEGESPLRSELLRIFIKMLGALTDRDAKILVDKCKAKRQKREKAQRMKRLQQTFSDAMDISSLGNGASGRRSARRLSSDISSEDVMALLNTVKEVNASMEAQELQLQRYMRSMGLEPPALPTAPASGGVSPFLEAA